MEKLNFKLKINAPKEKVWKALWDELNYRKWTSIFSETSHTVTDWKEGSEILFVDNDDNGMYGIIQKLDEPNEMTFKHYGELKNGKKKEESWSGALESYELRDDNGITELLVSMDTAEDFAEMFNNTFPKALNIVKEIAES